MQSYNSRGAGPLSTAYVAGGLIGSPKPKMAKAPKTKPKKPTTKRSR